MTVDPRDELVEVARSFVGVREVGANHGELVERFQREVDGVAHGEPWCMCFVQFCVAEVDRRFGTKSQLFRAEHCMSVWNRASSDARLTTPEPGAVVIWQRWAGDRQTSQGHTGIVVRVLNHNTFESIEGNTGGGPGAAREGDGVYAKRHMMNAKGSLRLRGFLRPWIEYGKSGFAAITTGDQLMATQAYKHEVHLTNGESYVIGTDGIRVVEREGENYVKVEHGNGVVYRYPRETVRVYIESPLQVTLNP